MVEMVFKDQKSVQAGHREACRTEICFSCTIKGFLKSPKTYEGSALVEQVEKSL